MKYHQDLLPQNSSYNTYMNKDVGSLKKVFAMKVSFSFFKRLHMSTEGFHALDVIISFAGGIIRLS